MDEGASAARRPRPVADIPPAALADGTAVAKAWLLALVAATPLDAVPALPAADLAREAPGLCAGVLRAVGSDAELDRLAPGGDLADLAARAGRLGGAGAPAAAAAAVGHLRAAAWDALAPAAGRFDAAHVAALAARLGHVCDLVTQAALTAPGRASGPLADALRQAGEAPAAGAEPAAAEPAAPRAPAGERGAPGTLRVAPEPAGEPAAGQPPLRVAGAPWPSQPGVRRYAGPQEVSEPADGERAPDDVAGGLVAVRGRPDAGRADPWTAAVARRLARHRMDGRPFVVLAVEADGAERLLASDHDGEAARALERAEEALRREIRADDVVVREHPGRVWLVAPEVDPADARLLGERLGDAVARAASLHGAPLTVSIGIAVCPDDATDPDGLVAHADEGVFAARAAGVRLA